MRNSLAGQSAFDFSTAASSAGRTTDPFFSQSDEPPTTGASFAAERPPEFERYGQVYATEARRAGRINAASVSESELSDLHRERQALLDKKFSGTITKPEANRLEYVRWSLDRIEDARSGVSLDVLEDWVSRYEDFLSQVNELKAELIRHSTRKGR